MKVLTYKQWKAERGESKEVELLDFIDFVRVNGSVYKFKEEGNTYAGEIWQAKSDLGQIKVIIKIDYPDETVGDNVGWNYKKEYNADCIDYWVNPLVDEYDTVIQKIRNNSFKRERQINLGLEREIKKEENIIKGYELVLNNIEKDSKEYTAITKYLNFVKSPTNQTLKEWGKVNRILKNKIKKLWHSAIVPLVVEAESDK